MPFRSRGILRETGSAIAVLAIYLLVLLAPLHQAAGLQRDFNALGYVSLDTASVCATLAKDDSGLDATKCAAAGIGKNQLAAVDLAVIAVKPAQVAANVGHPPEPASRPSTIDHHPGRPRAPPAQV